MIKIALPVEAFEAIVATLQFSSVGYENEANERASAISGSRARLSIGCARYADLARASATSFRGWPRAARAWRARREATAALLSSLGACPSSGGVFGTNLIPFEA
jgi:hypothetical protein